MLSLPAASKRVFIGLLWASALFLLIYVYAGERSDRGCYEELEKVRGAGRQEAGDVGFDLDFGDPSTGRSHDEGERLLLGETHVPTQEELFEAMEREQPSLPFRFWFLNEEELNRKRSHTNSCALLPQLYELRLHNQYWQTFEAANVTAQLFSAYFDDRSALPARAPVVRILAMVNLTEPPHPAAHCQLWYEGEREPLVVPVTEFRLIWVPAWGHRRDQLYPHLLTCRPPANVGRRVPAAVSLIDGAGDQCVTASNLLRVQHRPVEGVKRGFAVCVKGLDFPYEDRSARLVEWIELLRLLGADRIVFYQLQTHPNATRVLRHYEQRDLVELRPLTLARGRPSTPHLQHYLLSLLPLEKRLNEVIPYNDCFYRHANSHEYVVLLDVDEVAMPVGGRTEWAHLVPIGVEATTPQCGDGFASFCLRNVYFPSESKGERNGTAGDEHGHAPSYMYMLQHTRRSRVHLDSEHATKCLHRTDRVLTLHNHFPLGWLSSCAAYSMDPSVAQLQHYRDPDQEQVVDTVEDRSVWRYRDELVARSQQVLRELGFLSD